MPMARHSQAIFKRVWLETRGVDGYTQFMYSSLEEFP